MSDGLGDDSRGQPMVVSSRDSPGLPGQERESEGGLSDSWAPAGGNAHLPVSEAGTLAAPWPAPPYAVACPLSILVAAFLSSSVSLHLCRPCLLMTACLIPLPVSSAQTIPRGSSKAKFPEKGAAWVRWSGGPASSGEGCASGCVEALEHGRGQEGLPG